ncbi:hypothetical protein [Sphingomonas sp.]|uniref:DUF3617 domain-containing protein n=1 Tax=Sphingomonas sp. TaxID=28214 RepID=UPI002E340CFA|nr:hypothetical protein [Sphingomonas sp.]HEX4692966.1 hypothetical protein [Sphingomonas sp.]
MSQSKRLVIAGLAAGLLGAVASAAIPYAALHGLQRGRWQFKEIGTASGRVLCVSEPIQMIQFNHPGPACERFTVEDAPDHVTVQYNCGPRGYGRTTITVQQPDLIRLDAQGTSPGGQPFDASYEGRFLGPCASPAR